MLGVVPGQQQELVGARHGTSSLTSPTATRALAASPLPCRSTHPNNVRAVSCAAPWGRNVSRLSPVGDDQLLVGRLGMLPRGLIQRHHVGVEEEPDGSPACAVENGTIAWPPLSRTGLRIPTSHEAPRSLSRTDSGCTGPRSRGKHAPIPPRARARTEWTYVHVLTEPSGGPILEGSWVVKCGN